MDPAREPPWAEHEKVYLLAEILKAHPIPSHVLFGIIRDHNIQPRWTEMALPPGRSLRASQTAYDILATPYSGPDYMRPPMPATGVHHSPYAGPEPSRKRPLQQENAAQLGRLLQPRPPHPYLVDYNQVGGPSYTSTMSASGEPANKKKRGRPTKAEAQQRAQDAAARGEIYPPPRRGRVSITAPPEPSPLGSDPRHYEQRTPPTQTPSGFMGPAMTPQHQMQPEPGSESSSGKRRRTKPHPLELGPHRSLSEMESPLALGSSDLSRGQAYAAAYTPVSAPLPSSAESRDRDIRMEGVEETQQRTTTPHSFKDTVGI